MTTATADPTAQREQRTNMLLAFSGALARSRLGVNLDKQRVSATLGSILERQGECSLQPLHDLLTREMAVDAADAAGVLVWVKSNESRYGVSTTLPGPINALTPDQRAAALARFAVRRDDGAYARGATGSFAPPLHLREASGGSPAAREVSAPNKAAPAAAKSTTELEPQPGLALGAMIGVLVVTAILAVPVGLGAGEAGWNVSAMWAIRHALLLAFAVVLVVKTAPKGMGFGALFGGLGDDIVIVVGALLGGLAVGAGAQLVLPSARDASFQLGVVVAIAVVHVVVERLAWFSFQRGLGVKGALNPAVAAIILQLLAVFTFSSVYAGGALTWLGYTFLTVAAPTALLNHNRSIWPGLAWHAGFMLTTIGMS